MKRVLLEPAYVLHRRSYRESSFLIELFTREQGRVSVIAKGVRSPRSSAPGLLQPFVPLLVSFTGKGELMTLTQSEPNGEMKHLHGDCLFAGFYLNELIMCLLQKWDAHPALYDNYEKALIALQASTLEQKTLRSFEKGLLEELGYGLLPKTDISLQNTFSIDKYYRFIPEQGFVLNESGEQTNTFSGKNLMAIAKDDWVNDDVLREAKRLMRMVLTPLLGARPIYSRRLFLQVEEEKKGEE